MYGMSPPSCHSAGVKDKYENFSMKILHEICIEAGLGVLGENRDGCSGIRTRHLGNKIIRPRVAQFAL